MRDGGEAVEGDEEKKRHVGKYRYRVANAAGVCYMGWYLPGVEENKEQGASKMLSQRRKQQT